MTLTPRACLLVFLTALVSVSLNVNAQDTTWTNSDRQKLVDNYERTKKLVNDETKNLSTQQWNYRENDSSWSIAEVVEHLNMWHLITQDQTRTMFYNGPRPAEAMTIPSDSAITSFIYEEKKHTSPDISIPTGAVPDKANLKQFNILCDRIISNIKTLDINFRTHMRIFTDGYKESMNQTYIIHYGHIDRHLRQIARIKKSPRYPK